MKVHNRLVGILFVSLFIFGIFLLPEGLAAEKIAFVDLGEVFDGYVKTKEYDVKLEGVQKSKQDEIDTKVTEIKKLQDNLALLSAKEKEKKQVDIDSKTKELQEFQRNAEMELMKDRDTKLKEILKDIQDVIEKFAKKEGYSLVVNDRVLLYGDPGMDISKEILKQLNDNYNKKSK